MGELTAHQRMHFSGLAIPSAEIANSDARLFHADGESTWMVITRGYPASGKSTWAHKQLRLPGWKSASRDAIRQGPDKPDEAEVSRRERAQVLEWLTSGTNVVVDATNLEPVFAQVWADIARASGAEFEVQDFPVDVVECYRRNLERTGGARVRDKAFVYLGQKYPISDWGLILPSGNGDAAAEADRIAPILRQEEDDMEADGLLVVPESWHPPEGERTAIPRRG